MSVSMTHRTIASNILTSLVAFVGLAGCAQIVVPAGGDAAVDVHVPEASVADVQRPDGHPDVPPIVDVPPFMTAPHEPFPEIPDQGGTRLVHPHIVVITYADDTSRSDDEDYAAWMVHSDWLTNVGREYGVTAGDIVANVRLTQNAPIMTSSTTIEHVLGSGVLDGTFPQPTAGLTDTIYVVFFPSTSTIQLTDMGTTSTSCSEFLGYHSSFRVGTAVVPYAVVATCPDVGNPTQNLQVTVSHELIEAATDLDPLGMPALQFTLDTQSAWIALGGEVADLCEGDDLFDGTHWAARVWSNQAVRTGSSDPCVPLDTSQPYFNVSSSPDASRAVNPGDTVVFPLVGWSTARMADWDLALTPTGTLVAPMSLSTMRMNNGRTATVTVNVPMDAPSGSYAGILVYSMRSGTDYHVWPLLLYVQ